MPVSVPISSTTRIGLIAGFEAYDHLAETVGLLDELAFDSLWVGDHVAFTSPILDPMIQLAQAASLSARLTIGTAIYLLPLRPPAVAAKQAATLDHLSGGRFVFGVGVGGEFPTEYEACGIPVSERGARLTESIDVMRLLWRGEPCSFEGHFTTFHDVHMQPPALTPGGPAIWCGGRSQAALSRIGRTADGWISYVVTPEQYRAGLATIGKAADSVGRKLQRLGTGHVQFVRMGATREAALDAASAILSKRYAMDFRRATERYCALGSSADVLAQLQQFHAAGVRTFILDFLGTPAEQALQLKQFGAEVLPEMRAF
ncbi:MAG: LLM class flavin-dependent oxidoreductase [Pseudomonadota bacterium]